ncbi:MAG: S-methyl-5'-thioadenosine phosphorylase [Aestuariivita sp.]|nr:S-methyl-5'-thioadenosine phosphorylase [Aestuariivita sp.]
MKNTYIGIIGGSGIYDTDALQDATWQTVDSSFGMPSDQILTGQLAGLKIAFLPRHGRNHTFTPTSVPYRANIDALKRLGVTDIISVSAVGSFRDYIAPGDFVIVDQFIDRTFARKKSFFGPGLVAHVSVAHPTCPRISGACETALRNNGITVHKGGTYVAIEGPQFSTLAESKLYREQWGADIIGMTNMPEAKLAREAEICYASVAMVTDYDSWHPEHGEVSVSKIIETLQKNANNARAMITELPNVVNADQTECQFGCTRSLEYAIITPPNNRNPKMIKKLSAVAGRVL